MTCCQIRFTLLIAPYSWHVHFHINHEAICYKNNVMPISLISVATFRWEWYWSNYETGTVGQPNVILRCLWFEQLSRKVAIIHYLSWINPPIENNYLTDDTVICWSYQSGSSFQFVGRLMFGWGHTAQNSASPPGSTGLWGSCAFPCHIWYFICLHKCWHHSNSL